jgi:hypothetical protein
LATFAEASVVVVMNVPGVHDGTDPDPEIAITRIREAGVVAASSRLKAGRAKLSSSA